MQPDWLLWTIPKLANYPKFITVLLPADTICEKAFGSHNKIT